jgi:hypothetical protein
MCRVLPGKYVSNFLLSIDLNQFETSRCCCTVARLANAPIGWLLRQFCWLALSVVVVLLCHQVS